MQHQRHVLLVFLVLAVLTGVTLQAASSSLFERLAVPDTHIGGLVYTTTLVSVAAGAGTFFTLIRNTKAIRYTDEVVDELQKVTWPTREDTIRAASTVVLTTLFVALVVTFYDFLWKNVAGYFLLG